MLNIILPSASFNALKEIEKVWNFFRAGRTNLSGNPLSVKWQLQLALVGL